MGFAIGNSEFVGIKKLLLIFFLFFFVRRKINVVRNTLDTLKFSQ